MGGLKAPLAALCGGVDKPIVYIFAYRQASTYIECIYLY